MPTVVISYARADQPLVRAVVRLLRTAMREFEDPVYWDEDFEPGEAWREQFEKSVDCTPQLFVFWCAHSAHSRQVAEEFQYALQAGKRVVPILLDKTDLIPALGSIQGVDLRGAVKHRSIPRPGYTPGTGLPRPPGPSPASPSPSPGTSRPVPSAPPSLPRASRIRGLVLIVALLLAVSIVVITRIVLRPVLQPTAGQMGLFVAAVICAVAAGIGSRSRWRRSLPQSAPKVPQVPSRDSESTRQGYEAMRRELEQANREQDALESIDVTELLRAFQRSLRSDVEGG
jgi:hypothetical protein